MFASFQKQDSKDMMIDEVKNDIKFVEDKNILELINSKVLEAVQRIVKAKREEQDQLLSKVQRIEEENRNLRKREKILEQRLSSLETKKKRKLEPDVVNQKDSKVVSCNGEEFTLPQPRPVTNDNNNSAISTSTSSSNNEEFCPPLFRSDQKGSNTLPTMRVKPHKIQNEETEKVPSISDENNTSNEDTIPRQRKLEPNVISAITKELPKENIIDNTNVVMETSNLRPREPLPPYAISPRGVAVQQHPQMLRPPTQNMRYRPPPPTGIFPRAHLYQGDPRLMSLQMAQEEAIRFQHMQQLQFQQLSPQQRHQFEYQQRIEQQRQFQQHQYQQQQQQQFHQAQMRAAQVTDEGIFKTNIVDVSSNVIDNEKPNESVPIDSMPQRRKLSTQKQQQQQQQQQHPQQQSPQQKQQLSSQSSPKMFPQPVLLYPNQPQPPKQQNQQQLKQQQQQQLQKHQQNQLRPVILSPIRPRQLQMYHFQPQVLSPEQYNQLSMQKMPSPIQQQPYRDIQPRPEVSAGIPISVRPPPPYQETNSVSLPKLTATITSDTSNIILKWDCNDNTKIHQDNVKVYYLMAYHTLDLRIQAPSDIKLWKKIGEISALPLPIACTLTKSFDGHNYFFSVIPIDKNGNIGTMSNACALRVTL